MMNLKEIRKASGLTQKELAKKLDVADCTLAHYESGIRKITLEMFLKVLDACNLDIIFQPKDKLDKEIEKL